MKDIIVDPVQVEAAAKMGASAVLLIYQVFSGGYVGRTLSELVELAHSLGLEVLLEAGSEAEFSAALRTEADMVGINNRDLRTLKVDLGTTRRILTSVRGCGRIVVSESGIEGPEDVRLLHRCGANAFLIGSAVMLAENVEEKVRELVLSI
jgi:indole-3-glycerol phosphate synthase